MSTEATGDARPDAADQAEQLTAGGSTRSDEVSGAAPSAGETGEDGEAARGERDVRGEAVASGQGGPGVVRDAGAAGDGVADTGGTNAGGPDVAGAGAGAGAAWAAGAGAPGAGAPGTGVAGTGVAGAGVGRDDAELDEAGEAFDAEDDGFTEFGEDEGIAAEHGDRPDDADAPSELIDRAEPVELDEPGAALHPTRRWTRVLITLGFVLLAAAIVGGAIAIVGSITHGFKKPVKVTYRKSAIFSLKTGDCLDPSGQTYTLVSCGTPHDAEVFATFELPSGQWPGNTAVAADASSGCASRLTGYLNPQLAISLASTYVYPDATAWQAGTRTVVCEVKAASGQLTGSVKGASATAG